MNPYTYRMQIVEEDSGRDRLVFVHRFTPAEMFKIMEALSSYSYREWFSDIFLKMEGHGRNLVEHELDLMKMTEAYEANLIQMALVKTGGNQTHAAKLLKVGRTTLVEKAKRYGIKHEEHDYVTQRAYMIHVVENIEEKLMDADTEPIQGGELTHFISRLDKLRAKLKAKQRAENIKDVTEIFKAANEG